MEFARRWNVLLRNLWGRKWSSHPIPPPSFPNWNYTLNMYSDFSNPGLFSITIFGFSHFYSTLWFLSCYWCSDTKLCLTFYDPMNSSTSDFPVLPYLPEFSQMYVHCVDGATQQSHPLSPPSLPAFNLLQYQGVFQWVSSSHQVAKFIGALASASVLMNIQGWFPLSFLPISFWWWYTSKKQRRKGKI